MDCIGARTYFLENLTLKKYSLRALARAPNVRTSGPKSSGSLGFHWPRRVKWPSAPNQPHVTQGGGTQNSQFPFQALLHQIRKIDAQSFTCQFPAIGYFELLINRHNDCHPIEPFGFLNKVLKIMNGIRLFIKSRVGTYSEGLSLLKLRHKDGEIP